MDDRSTTKLTARCAHYYRRRNHSDHGQSEWWVGAGAGQYREATREPGTEWLWGCTPGRGHGKDQTLTPEATVNGGQGIDHARTCGLEEDLKSPSPKALTQSQGGLDSEACEPGSNPTSTFYQSRDKTRLRARFLTSRGLSVLIH